MATTIENVETRQRLIARLVEARRQTDSLFELVKPEARYARPIPERHRIIFYLGHLEAFDWNLMQRYLPGMKVLDPGLDELFAFGIDPIGGGLPSDTPADWPAEAEVRSYGGNIRAELDEALTRAFSDWSDAVSPITLLNTAIEHRLMHAETLAYMLHQLPVDNKLPQRQVRASATPPGEPSRIKIPAGRVELGLAPGGDNVFGWDNEFNAHEVDVPAFCMDRYKVTNSQFLRFLEEGGYQQQSLWTPADWEWKERQGIRHPLFWKRMDGTWLYRTMFDEIPLPGDWPVYVSHAEAGAYARWAGGRLPSEAEWQRAAYGMPDGPDREYPWGTEGPATEHGYFHFGRWDASPVNAFPASRSGFGVESLLANGWEWTESVFAPFPGFRTFPFYEGYSSNFFDGMHYVLKGGSARTDRSMLRRSFRNWFQPYYQYVYAGFRCVSC